MRFYIGNTLLEITNTNNQHRENTRIYDNADDIWQMYMSIRDEKKSASNSKISLSVSDYKAVTQKLQSKFRMIRAAGGLIFDKNKVLFIFRQGKWDLPKGKIDKGESVETAALREVWEECQVKATVCSLITDTWHTYSTKKGDVLKQTFWYYMKAIDTSKQRPEIAEGIEKLVWVEFESCKIQLENTYPSIIDVINAYQSA